MVERPDLGQGAPRVAVVFPDPGVRERTAIYVWTGTTWLCVFTGDYRRGSLFSGRGGVGNRYRLIDAREHAVDLVFGDGELRLVRGDVVIARVAVGALRR